jgi:hypothetical protein
MDSTEEETLFEKDAGHFRGFWTVGGKLILTEKHLIFKPHRFNIGAKTVNIRLEDIVDIREKGSVLERFLVATKDGKYEQFGVWDRD